ncbi:MAG: hypothetical protein Q4F06_03280, partial [Eubacteriales bacterium]|nr:hypothetical protein [Eubacteriales bacterium]
PQFNAGQPQFGTQPQFNVGQPQFGVQQPVAKKKKKWPLVVGILVVVIAIVAVLTAIFVPRFLSLNNSAAKALKNVGSTFETTVNEYVDNVSSGSVSVTKNELKGSIKLNSLSYEGDNYASYLNVDTVNYNIQTDLTTGCAGGTISLSKGTSTPVINCTFYTDGSNLYFKVPELFSETFKVSSSSSSSISSSLNLVGGMSSSDIQAYAPVVKAIVSDFAKGIDKLADECTYKKVEGSTYQSENGDIKVKIYDVTVSEKALTEAFNTFIDAVYADSAISPYITLLGATGVTQSSVKTEFASVVKGVNATFRMYVNNNNKIVKFSADLSNIVKGASGTVSMEFIGKDNPGDYIIAQYTDEDNFTLKATLKESGNISSVQVDIVPDQNQYPGEFLSVGMDGISVSGNSCTINNVYAKGNIDGENLDVSCGISCTDSEFTKLNYSTSNFTGTQVNLDYITSSQKTQLMTELSTKTDVLKKIFSDKMINQLIINGNSSKSSSSLTY